MSTLIGRQFGTRGARRDEGAALIAVVGAMGILSLLLLSALTFALKNAEPSRRDQDAKAAIAAAQAGLDEYISRLNSDPGYYVNGNVDASNAALTATGSGQTIQGTGTAGARYRYQVLTTAAQTAQDGVIRLKVTGMNSPGAGRTEVQRTLTANLRPKGFLSFIYLSDLEVFDPAITGQSTTTCSQYYYSGRGSSCTYITWGQNDVVNGPLHSNDAVRIDPDVDFTNPKTETSWPATSGAAANAKTWWGNATYPLAGYSPKYAPPISLPDANDELLKNVEPDVDGDSSTPVGPGCYYTGATRIIFQGSTMRVYSPNTSRSDTPTRCLTVSQRGTEQTKAIPPVIYIDGVSGSCSGAGYPATNEAVTTGSETDVSWDRTANGVTTFTTNYDCNRGTTFVEGTTDTPVTVAAKDDVVVTGDLEVADNRTGTDVVGLIAGNCVWVYNPIQSNGTNLLSGSDVVHTVEAAVLALRHSFIVQNYNEGSQIGTLNITGALNQKFRGPVALSGSTGYVKNYVYDARLAYLQPPFFLKPSSSPWEIASVTDK